MSRRFDLERTLSLYEWSLLKIRAHNPPYISLQTTNVPPLDVGLGPAPLISTLYSGFGDSCFSVLLAVSHYALLGIAPGSCTSQQWQTEDQMAMDAMQQ